MLKGEGGPAMSRGVGVALAGAVAVSACGGSTSSLGGGSGSAGVSGTADGSPVPSSDVVGLVGSQTSNGVTEAYAGVIITNVAGACAVLQRHGNPPSTTALSIVAVTAGSAVPAGQYSVGPQTVPAASASFSAQDQSCNSTAGEQATSGTLTLTAVSGATLTGSFDLTFANGDHLTGSFVAPVCDAAILSNGNNSACGS
jgi:hypothetical protein